MTELRTLHLSIGDVLLQAPETVQYLDVAAQLLEMRRRELEAGVPGVVQQPTPAPPRPGPRETDTVPAAEAVSRPPAPAPTPPAPEGSRSSRRPRWFHDQLPQVALADGSTRVLRSLEELRDLLQEHGLQPHPRGDASMLLWQVRNRLRLAVEPVSPG